jgi:hypothetical protein
MRSVFLILTRRRKTWVQTLSHLIQHCVYAMHLSQKQKHSPTTCLEHTLSANEGRPTWSLLFKISDTTAAPTGKTLICIQGLALSLKFLVDSFLQCKFQLWRLVLCLNFGFLDSFMLETTTSFSFLMELNRYDTMFSSTSSHGTCWWTPATVPKGVATNRKISSY